MTPGLFEVVLRNDLQTQRLALVHERSENFALRELGGGHRGDPATVKLATTQV